MIPTGTGEDRGFLGDFLSQESQRAGERGVSFQGAFSFAWAGPLPLLVGRKGGSLTTHPMRLDNLRLT
jgi:hypothetical protein